MKSVEHERRLRRERDWAKAASQLQLIHDLSLKLQSRLDTQDIYRDIVTWVQKKFHYTSFSIWSVEESDTAVIRAQAGAYNRFLKVGFAIKNEGIVGTVIKTRNTYSSGDVSRDPHFTRLNLPVATRSQLAVPVFSEEKLIAVLSVEDDRLNAFDDDDVYCFEVLSTQLGVTITNVTLYNRIRSLNQDLRRRDDERSVELQRVHERLRELMQRTHFTPSAAASPTGHSPSLKASHHKSTPFIANNPLSQALLAVASKFAIHRTPLLLHGESGTGKTHLARHIHHLSPATTSSTTPLVIVDGADFGSPQGMLPSERSPSLPQNGQTSLRRYWESARRGTLILRNIDSLHSTHQGSLMKWLRQSNDPHAPRVLATTECDLLEASQRGRFRRDLFLLLSGFMVSIPPLRDRQEDILPLLAHFMEVEPGRTFAPVPQPQDPVFLLLRAYPWPHNVKELKNLVERLRILSDGKPLTVDDIPLSLRGGVSPADPTEAPPSLSQSLEDLERTHILRVLNHLQNNKIAAAATLGITLKTLYNKLHRYGISVDARPRVRECQKILGTHPDIKKTPKPKGSSRSHKGRAEASHSL